MNIDQINEFINKGGAAFALLIIAFILVLNLAKKAPSKK